MTLTVDLCGTETSLDAAIVPLWDRTITGVLSHAASTGPDLNAVIAAAPDFALAQAIRGNRLSNEAWERFFALYGIEPLRLTYEQIIADPAAAAARVAAHCGLKPGGQDSVQEFDDPPLRSQTTALNSAWEVRFRQEA